MSLETKYKNLKEIDDSDETKKLIEDKIKEEEQRGFLDGEWHIPGYKYCGPGTKVASRFMRGDKPRNELDAACKEHDVDYMIDADNDEELIKDDIKLVKAAEKFIVKHPSFWDTLDRLAAHFVAGVFKVKGGLEKSGVWKPTTFAEKLSKGANIQKEKKIGKKLKTFLNKY